MALSGYGDTFFVLLQMICVVVVVAYLITRTASFTQVLDGVFTWKGQAILTLLFGALSIYGTESGITILGATANVRDLGPMVGGLACGPVVGLGAGLIGAAYRFSLGGFTALPCAAATVLAGLFGGLIFLLAGRKFIGMHGAVLFAVGMEAFHMGLTLAICRPFEQALTVVEGVALPMTIANATGVFVFALIIGNLIAERQTKAERDTYLSELERKKAELRIAHDIQMSFLPERLPEVPGIELAALSLPAKEVGGDFYDAIPLPGDRTAFAIADVAGKGVPAALFMALSRTVLRANTLVPRSAREAVGEANSLIAEDAKSGMFVTLFYAVADPAKRTLTYVNAGHNPPLLFRSGAVRPVRLEGTGIILGVMPEAEYGEETVALASGDLLLLYTDGITEAINPGEEQFGEERLIETVTGCRDLSPGEIVDRIRGAVAGFSGDEPQFDDQTLMILRVV
ncbi:SpoIIE family protein phosphatase [Methanoculleus sp. Wushi-C6]|uniref:SpoIIE family protein phosphatase n=1 Tax=Methanoculleus caldifontis TaxID=2651577 RepID=A0ABU3WZH1_9EURY|nr:SpoIIE family protein phosphatase [Methanoculleus sp. Wushi-C6]MDV2481111.1 SpoIIE family protein phosphatase [Methanoculleus sp. Wushi-C6]